MGNMIEYIKMAIHNILANKGRSFLTMLGIIIGITSVIAIVSIGQGTTNQMNSEINDVGAGQIYIYCSDDAISAESWITPEDVEDIRELKDVEGVSVSETLTGETVTGKGNFSLNVTGDTQDGWLVSNDTMKRGTYLTDADVADARNVCVISEADAKRLFGTDDVVGMDVDVTCYEVTKTYQIVGVTATKENGTFVSYTYEGMPAYITVPYTSLTDFAEGMDQFYSVNVFGDKNKDSKEVTDQVIHLLERNHQSAGDDYFQVQSFQDVLKTMNQMMG
ncbi:MAG: ABC transporter permease, partial [Blautia sp.]